MLSAILDAEDRQLIAVLIGGGDHPSVAQQLADRRRCCRTRPPAPGRSCRPAGPRPRRRAPCCRCWPGSPSARDARGASPRPRCSDLACSHWPLCTLDHLRAGLAHGVLEAEATLLRVERGRDAFEDRHRHRPGAGASATSAPHPPRPFAVVGPDERHRQPARVSVSASSLLSMFTTTMPACCARLHHRHQRPGIGGGDHDAPARPARSSAPTSATCCGEIALVPGAVDDQRVGAAAAPPGGPWRRQPSSRRTRWRATSSPGRRAAARSGWPGRPAGPGWCRRRQRGTTAGW